MKIIERAVELDIIEDIVNFAQHKVHELVEMFSNYSVYRDWLCENVGDEVDVKNYIEGVIEYREKRKTFDTYIAELR